MFFIPGILGRKGPFAVVWIARHDIRLLSKKDVTDADLQQFIDVFENKLSLFSLGISSDLLVGICNLALRQINYASHDFGRFSQQFFKFMLNRERNEPIDLPPNKLMAHLRNINLPDIDTLEEDLQVLILSRNEDENVAPIPRITLPEVPPISTDENLLDKQNIDSFGDQIPSFDGNFGDLEPPRPSLPELDADAEPPQAVMDHPPGALETPPNEIEQRRRPIDEVQSSEFPELGDLILSDLTPRTINRENRSRTRRPVTDRGLDRNRDRDRGRDEVNDRVRRTRRLNLIMDQVTQIEIESDNMNFDSVIPSIALPFSFQPVGNVFTAPERPLPAALMRYFNVAINSDRPAPRSPPPAESEELLVGDIPPLPTDPPSPIPRLPADDLSFVENAPLDDDQEIPRIRMEENAPPMVDSLLRSHRFDHSRAESIHLTSLREMSHNWNDYRNGIPFDPAYIRGNRNRIDAAGIFAKLMDAKTRNEVNLYQQPGYDRFNELLVLPPQDRANEAHDMVVGDEDEQEIDDEI